MFKSAVNSYFYTTKTSLKANLATYKMLYQEHRKNSEAPRICSQP